MGVNEAPAGETARMWLVLCAALALVVFGSKVASALCHGVLFAVHKVGLLSNIPIDRETKLQLTVHAVHVRLWRNVWRFVRSPTQEPLITVEIIGVDLLITRNRLEAAEARCTETSSPSKSVLMSELLHLDTSESLKRLSHPIWMPIRAWVHRLSFLCFTLPLVGLCVNDVDADIVEETSGKSVCVCHVKDASARLVLRYNLRASDLVVTLSLCSSKVCSALAPELKSDVSVHGLEVSVAVPWSRSDVDQRAPIPSNISVSCRGVSGSIDLALMTKCFVTSQSHRESKSNAKSGNAMLQSHLRRVARSNYLLPVRLAAVLPSVNTTLSEMHVVFTNASAADMDLRVTNFVASVRDPAKGRLPKADDGELVEERSIAASICSVSLSSSSALPAVCGTSIRAEYLEVDVETSILAHVSGSDLDDNHGEQRYARPVWTSRVTAESRGISISLTDDISFWVAVLYDSTRKSSARTDDESMLLEQREETELGGVNQYQEQQEYIIDLQAQCKVLRTELTCVARDITCEVLPDGVPDVCLAVDEIVMFAHPFTSETTLGVRAKADIQASKLKLFYSQRDHVVKTSFLSLDFVRVFIEPVSVFGTHNNLASVEMEAEWLEVRWTPQAMHSIGGVLELFFFVLAPILVEEDDWFSDQTWLADAATRIQAPTNVTEVAKDVIGDDEMVSFRCRVKNSSVAFSYIHHGCQYLESVTVSTLIMSVEDTTGRFRLSLEDTNIFNSHGAKSSTPTTRPHYESSRRRPTMLPSKSFKSTSRHAPVNTGQDRTTSPYFSVRLFSLEENRVSGCPWKVLDMFVEGVSCTWQMSTQARVVELIRRITFSTWEMLYRMRSAYAMYCTHRRSRYNRTWGLNPPFNNEQVCRESEAILAKLISAGGDNLNRIYVSDVNLNAKFSDGKQECSIHLSVGAFNSSDLPEVWLFENVVLKYEDKLEVLSVERVSVRHTIQKRADYVFGFFEELLSLRRRACGKTPTTSPRDDGMLIDIEGVRLGLSLEVDLFRAARIIEGAVSPFVETHMHSFLSPWRPQHEIFYLYFLRIPQSPGQPNVWLRVNDIHIDCKDRPLEEWLGRIYPIWMEELAEQELRVQLLEEQLATLKLTNADILQSDTATNEVNALLREKNSKVYVHKVKKQDACFHQGASNTLRHTSPVIAAHVNSLSMDITFDANEARIVALMKNLDESTKAIDRTLQSIGISASTSCFKFSLLVHQRVEVQLEGLTVHMRNFHTPVLVVEKIKTTGDVILAAASAPMDRFALTGNIKCFAGLDVSIERPITFFGPGYIYTMEELLSIAQHALPTLLLDIDKCNNSTPWDVMRRIFHGNVRLSVQDASLRLLSSSNIFESGGYLEVAVHSVQAKLSREGGGMAVVDIDRLTAKIEPDAIVNIAELSNLHLVAHMRLNTRVEPSTHWVFPVEVVGLSSLRSGVRYFVDFQSGMIWEGGVLDQDDVVHNRLDTYAAKEFSTSIHGRISPKSPPEVQTRRDIASRSAIVLYTKHVEWLIYFGRVYQRLQSVSFPRRYPKSNRDYSVEIHSGANGSKPTSSIIEKFLTVFSGVSVEDFAFIGLDLALYHSEKSPVGIRACINDRITLSGSMHKQSDKAGRATIKTSLPIEMSGFVFAPSDVSLAVRDFQVRICTPTTGSRGESLVSIQDVGLSIGGDRQKSSFAHAPFEFEAMHSEFDFSNAVMSTSTNDREKECSSRTASFSSTRIAASSDNLRTRSKKNILEHFSIPQHNPYHYKDDNDLDGSGPNLFHDTDDQDSLAVQSQAIQEEFKREFRRQGFTLGLAASQIRILVTLETVETLIDIAENWIHVVRGCLPDLQEMPDELSNPVISSGQAPPQLAGMESPKRVTSLADDPKFGAIFHASNPIPNSRAFSFSNEDEQTTQQTTSSPSSVVEPFLIVRFIDCQINVQDHQHKGSVLLALNCGSLRHSRSLDVCHELVDLKVDGIQLLTAPLDVDVKSRVIWLRTEADGITYCSSSYGLLNRVVAPIPSQVMIWIDRDITVTNRVDLQIPTVQIGVNIDTKNILQNLVIALANAVASKLAEYQTPDYSKMLQGFGGAAKSSMMRSSMEQLLETKRELKWKIAELHWRQMCRWNYQSSERANLAMHAAEGIRNYGLIDLDGSTTAILRPMRMSSASLLTSMPTSISLTGSSTTQVETVSDEMQRLHQQLESITEVLRSLIAAEVVKRQPNPNVQLDFTLHSASLTLSGNNSDIISAAMTNLKVKVKAYEDQSGTFALTIQDVTCKNLCPNTPYPELLLPLSNPKSWSGDEMFVRLDAELAPPVGGITVVRHFEINVHPMQVCLTYDLILQLVSFFTSAPGPTARQEERKAEIRSQFLSAPQQFASSSGDGLLKKAVKVAGKAAHPITHGLGRHRADGDQSQDPRVRAMQTLHEEATLWISKVAQGAGLTTVAEGDSPSGPDDKDVNEMRDRAKTNIMFKRIRLGTVEVMVSFKNKKSAQATHALEDMRGFEVKIHSLVYCDKTCSLVDLLLRIRRDIILDVLSQVGRNFTNVANFLRDQFDISRWAAFDALAPLKSLSTAITGSSNASSTSTTAPTVAPPSSSTLSIDMIQRSPRVSRDGAYPGVSSSSPATTAVDTSKVFQLELPQSHPSRRKKHTSRLRAPEPTTTVAIAASTALPPSPLMSPKSDQKEQSDASTGKSKKMLSGLFSKSKKTLGGSTSTPHADASST